MADYSSTPEPVVKANIRNTDIVFPTEAEQQTFHHCKGEKTYAKDTGRLAIGENDNRLENQGGTIVGANALEIGGKPLDISGIIEGQTFWVNSEGKFVPVTIMTSDQINTLLQDHVLLVNPHNTTYNSLSGVKPPNDATHNSSDEYLLDLANHEGVLPIEKISGFDEALTEKVTAPATATAGALAAFGNSPNIIGVGPQIKTTISETPSNTYLVSELAVVEYIQNNTASSNSKVYRKDNVISVADYENAPPTSNEGDRYLLSKVDGTFLSGSIHIDWGSVLPGDIVYRDQGVWKQDSNQSPTEGWTTYLESENLFAYIVFNGEVGKWAFGTIGKPVDEYSNDTNKNKLVSNFHMKQILEHIESNHSGVISFIVNKEYIESVLQGEITSHTHPQSGGDEELTNFEAGSSVQLTNSLPLIGIVETVFSAEEV